MKKFLVLVFAVLALSGCWITAGQVILDSRILDMKLPKQQKPINKNCSSKPCEWWCSEKLDNCFKKAKANCIDDFEILKTREYSHGFEYYYSCKEPPKERRSSK